MTSNISVDLPLSTTVHALADSSAIRLTTIRSARPSSKREAALAAFAAVLEDPLGDIDPRARRAYLAALVLRATLAAMPGAACCAAGDRGPDG